MMKNIKKYFPNKINVFDAVVGISFLILTISFLIFFFRKTQYITVRLEVTEKNVLYSKSAPPDWFVYLLKKGMVEKDGLGRTTAEILDTYSYDAYSPDVRAVYVTAKISTTFNERSNQYKHNGNTVSVGEGIRINFNNVLVDGLIVDIEGLSNPYSEKFINIDAQILYSGYNGPFSETTGVDQFIPDAINVGDKIYDSNNNVMAEVTQKEVRPARKNTFDSSGHVYSQNDPRLKDVILSLKVRVNQINNNYYFFDDYKIEINKNIPLHFKNISIDPTIIRIDDQQ